MAGIQQEPSLLVPESVPLSHLIGQKPHQKFVGVPVPQAANGLQDRDGLAWVPTAFDLEDHPHQARRGLLLPLHVQHVIVLHGKFEAHEHLSQRAEEVVQGGRPPAVRSGVKDGHHHRRQPLTPGVSRHALVQFQEAVHDIACEAELERALARALGLHDHHDGALPVGVEGPGAVGNTLVASLLDRTGRSRLQGLAVNGAEVERVGQHLCHLVGEDGTGQDALVTPIMNGH